MRVAEGLRQHLRSNEHGRRVTAPHNLPRSRPAELPEEMQGRAAAVDRLDVVREFAHLRRIFAASPDSIERIQGRRGAAGRQLREALLDRSDPYLLQRVAEGLGV